MDKINKTMDWSWLPKAMPTVASRIAEMRKAHGSAWIDQCWSRSMAGEPGWFFAREGALTIGTPDPVCEQCYGIYFRPGSVDVFVRDPKVGV